MMVNAGYLLELLSTVNYAFNFYIYVLTAAPFRAVLRGLCVCSPARWGRGEALGGNTVPLRTVSTLG